VACSPPWLQLPATWHLLFLSDAERQGVEGEQTTVSPARTDRFTRPTPDLHLQFEFGAPRAQLSISQGGGGKTGLDVWDGALLLTDHLLSSGSLEEQRVVELGAGTGAPNPLVPPCLCSCAGCEARWFLFCLSHLSFKAS
jgi:hypothetical protein